MKSEVNEKHDDLETPAQEPEITDDVAKGEPPVPQVVRVEVDKLKPNPINPNVFSHSLTDEGLELLEKDIDVHGVLVPILINDKNEIVDGQRRYLVCKKKGIKEMDAIKVVMEGEDDLSDLVVGLFAGARNPTVGERVRVFELAKKKLQERQGRKRGRPNKSVGIPLNFLTADQIGEMAAKMSGLGTYDTARRAAKVFAEEDDTLKKAVNAGSMSINEAYNRLMAPQKKAKAKSEAKVKPGNTDTAGDTASNSSPAPKQKEKPKPTKPTQGAGSGNEQKQEQDSVGGGGTTDSGQTSKTEEDEDDDPAVALDKLLGEMKRYLALLCVEDFPSAESWLESACGQLSEIVNEARPADQD